MTLTHLALAALLLVASLPNGAASPPGNISWTSEVLALSEFDFNDGTGIADPTDPNNPCTTLAMALSTNQPADTWSADQNLGTNLNGHSFGIGPELPFTPMGGWLPNSRGFNLGLACPLPGSGTGSLWLVWSGMEWQSLRHASFARLDLCTQETFPSSSPGCLPSATDIRLTASACDPTTVAFSHNYTDAEGGLFIGIPFDTLAMQNDALTCTVRHSHDYSPTVTDLSSGRVAQTTNWIDNAAVVHPGAGTTYMAVCWQIEYLNFSDPLNPASGLAQAHDWKLILDLDDPAGVAGIVASIGTHYGASQTTDSGPTTALRGFYSGSPTMGQNGFGPCPNAPSGPETACHDYAGFYDQGTFINPPHPNNGYALFSVAGLTHPCATLGTPYIPAGVTNGGLESPLSVSFHDEQCTSIGGIGNPVFHGHLNYQIELVDFHYYGELEHTTIFQTALTFQVGQYGLNLGGNKEGNTGAQGCDFLMYSLRESAKQDAWAYFKTQLPPSVPVEGTLSILDGPNGPAFSLSGPGTGEFDYTFANRAVIEVLPPSDSWQFNAQFTVLNAPPCFDGGCTTAIVLEQGNSNFVFGLLP